MQCGITTSPAYEAVQVTTIQADAADDAAIAAVCKQAIDEEGQLDVFFANVCLSLPSGVPTHDAALGWSIVARGTARHHSGAVHGDYANQLSFVSSVMSSECVRLFSLRCSPQLLLSDQTCLASYDAHEPFERQDVERWQHHIDRFGFAVSCF